MSFWGLMNTTGTVYRRTAIVAGPVALSALNVADRAPSEPFRVEVEVEAPSGAVGSVIVAGPVAGTTQTQALDFAPVGGGSKGRLGTTYRWDADTLLEFALTGTWANAAGTTATVYAVDGDGTQRKLLTSVGSGIPMRIDRRGPTGKPELPRDGAFTDNKATLFLPPGVAWSPRVGDEVVDAATGIRWRVLAAPSLDDAVNEHHFELPLIRHEISP